MRSRIEALAPRERERESRRLRHIFYNIISVENLLISWREFLRGKRQRHDMAIFSTQLTDNIFKLHAELKDKSYRQGMYKAFKINDPKPRDIHKASVHDRLVHHALYRVLYPYFDRQFIHDSYSCRDNKGTHRAINRFRAFGLKVSKNNTRTCWVLKCDIRKFFASIDHGILKCILSKHITDDEALGLLIGIIDSFSVDGKNDVGLPLGNLTSQLLVNIYMNELDQFVKRKLRVKYYIRYADDFVLLHEDKKYLGDMLLEIENYLRINLKLELHPDKVYIKTLSSGVDFLGWVSFATHRVLRTSTKRRMLKKLGQNTSREALASYDGLLGHGNAYKISQELHRHFDNSIVKRVDLG